MFIFKTAFFPLPQSTTAQGARLHLVLDSSKWETVGFGPNRRWGLMLFIRTSRCFDSHVCDSKRFFLRFFSPPKACLFFNKIECMTSIPLLSHRCEFRSSSSFSFSKQSARCQVFLLVFWGFVVRFCVFAWPKRHEMDFRQTSCWQFFCFLVGNTFSVSFHVFFLGFCFLYFRWLFLLWENKNVPRPDARWKNRRQRYDNAGWKPALCSLKSSRYSFYFRSSEWQDVFGKTKGEAFGRVRRERLYPTAKNWLTVKQLLCCA